MYTTMIFLVGGEEYAIRPFVYLPMGEMHSGDLFTTCMHCMTSVHSLSRQKVFYVLVDLIHAIQVMFSSYIVLERPLFSVLFHFVFVMNIDFKCYYSLISSLSPPLSLSVCSSQLL